MFNCFTSVPSVTEIVFVVMFVAVNGPSGLLVCSLQILTLFQEFIRHLVAEGNFELKALPIRPSATIVSISAITVLRAFNCCILSGDMLLGYVNDEITPNTIMYGTNLSGHTVSAIALVLSFRISLSSSE